jgi:hypothetical protein
MRDEQNPLGWFDRELTKRMRDHKEVFDFVDPAAADQMNRWPELSGFRDAMIQHFNAMSTLAQRTLDLLHSVLQLGESSSEELTFARPGSTVRLNLYTVGDPVPDDERDGLADLGDGRRQRIHDRRQCAKYVGHLGVGQRGFLRGKISARG